MRAIVWFICGVLLAVASTTEGAERYTRNGYNLRLESVQEQTELIVTGRIEGGTACRQLRLDLQLRDDHGRGKRIMLRVGEVGGIYSRLLEKRLKVSLPERPWTIDQIEARCEEP